MASLSDLLNKRKPVAAQIPEASTQFTNVEEDEDFVAPVIIQPASKSLNASDLFDEVDDTEQTSEVDEDVDVTGGDLNPYENLKTEPIPSHEDLQEVLAEVEQKAIYASVDPVQATKSPNVTISKPTPSPIPKVIEDEVQVTEHEVSYEPKESEVESKVPFSTELYSSTMEHLIGGILTDCGISNISLSVFGPQAQLYKPQSLAILPYKMHQFVGKQNNEESYWNIVWMIEDYVREQEKHVAPGIGIPIKLVNIFTSNGVRYCSLLLTEDEIKRYAQCTKRRVALNNPSSEEDLAVVVYGHN